MICKLAPSRTTRFPDALFGAWVATWSLFLVCAETSRNLTHAASGCAGRFGIWVWATQAEVPGEPMINRKNEAHDEIWKREHFCNHPTRRSSDIGLLGTYHC